VEKEGKILKTAHGKNSGNELGVWKIWDMIRETRNKK